MTPRDSAAPPGGDIPWRAIATAALEGDRAAYARLVRLVTRYLSRWRAFDFRADWDDIVQEVLIATLKTHAEGRFDSEAAFQAFVRQTARFKFIDRIRDQKRATDEEVEDLTQKSETAPLWAAHSQDEGGEKARMLRLSIRDGLARLGERERAAVLAVHVRGMTYEEAAEATGIPFGSLKRELRAGLAKLRSSLDGY